MRRSTTLGLLSLAMFTALAATAVGCDAFSNCEALCGSFVTVSGPLELPTDGRELTFRTCFDSQCESCDAVYDPASISCEDGVFAQRGDDGRFVFVLGHEPYVGAVIEVEVTDTATGEALLDVSRTITSVEETETCGNVCSEATVSWDEEA